MKRVWIPFPPYFRNVPETEEEEKEHAKNGCFAIIVILILILLASLF